MRIGGEAPRRRAHSKARWQDQVTGRVAATSVRQLQLGIKMKPSCRTQQCCPRWSLRRRSN